MAVDTHTPHAPAASTTAPGTFTPAPRRASIARLVAAQGRVETRLFLRHGEQQLLSLIIPLGMLFGLSAVPVLDTDDPMRDGFPMMLAIAATSSGFTGQAIALAFDRRYGALKRTGASGVPSWTIIVGKIIAVASMVVLQTVILGAVAWFLGWRTTPLGMLMGAVVLIVGAAAFTAMGLLMGGTLSSEIVLALANLIWVVLVGIVGFVVYTHGLTGTTWWDLIPSVALASGLTDAFTGTVPWPQLASLAIWAIAVSAATTRWFRFSS
ncbi:ABC transporter permease [Corynebacterium uberis]|uniref:ABC transporter permease n=1 Tax=Corynebacterium TaxID=1716 RepID=UPI001D09C44E|nr:MULTISPECIES: ABC transporter permease [Corynebacterium]MCZ9308610.1 ABC transporter permease [Corynebacterium sp. c6VSa_13]UDL74255.1 ABC transporter permease [Corynebacterium uberis]UDL74865.1 ABC transporter permease [Corynebacterium uberis]UDL77079.1 ABC transporter permease [Corynebacterium uberis]UDL79362.1 ABC transporter permease [Corynebacterium uberis]